MTIAAPAPAARRCPATSPPTSPSSARASRLVDGLLPIQDRSSLKVVLVEREHAGFGASGRNGGWASSIFPVSLAHVAKLYDHSAALRLQAAMNQSVTEIGDVVAAEGIHCDYAREGFLSLARNEAQLARAKPRSLGQRSSAPPGNGSSCPRPRHATGSAPPVCSADLHRALRPVATRPVGTRPGRRFEPHGGVIYENTAADSIDNGTIRTNRGTVTASAVVRATEAYTPQFAAYRRDVAPLYSL